jgi:hypothetical protein
MRKLHLIALVALAAACRQPEKAERPAGGPVAPTFGRVEALWEVRDKESGERLGFVERYRYDDGRMIYWVNSADRETKHGYITANNNAYRYVWIAGRRTEQVEFLGADTVVAGSRRVLGYARPVRLEETSLESLAKAMKPKAEEPLPKAPVAEGDEGGCGCGGAEDEEE